MDALFRRIVTLAVLLTTGLLGATQSAWPSPTKVDGGIRFTYSDPNSGSVTWVGAYNAWNASANPMAKDASGTWTIVLPLPAGEHEYKFVVDGQYVADPENGVTRGDFGNSVVSVDANGNVVSAQATSNTAYSPKVFMGGRVIGLYQLLRNEETKRYELRRPEQDIDLRFDIRMSDLVKARFLMNINGEAQGSDFFRTSLTFDRGSLEFIQPKFQIYGYDNEDAGTWNDPLHLLGSVGIYRHGFGYGRQGFRARSQHWGFETEAQYADNFETGGGYPTIDRDALLRQLGGPSLQFMAGDSLSSDAGSRSDGNENVFALRTLRSIFPGLRAGFLAREDRGFDLGAFTRLDVTTPSELNLLQYKTQRQWLAGGFEIAYQPSSRISTHAEFLRGQHRADTVSASRSNLRVVRDGAETRFEEEDFLQLTPGNHSALDLSNRFRIGGTWTAGHGDIAVAADVEHQDHSYSIIQDGLENSMTVWRLDWDRNWRYYLGREVKTKLGLEFTNFDYDPNTPWSYQFWIPTGNFWLEHGEHEIRVDRLVMLGGGDVITVRPALEVPVFRTRNVTFRYDGLINTSKLRTIPKYSESLFKLGVDLTTATRLSTDTRWVKYDDPILGLDDGYVAHFVEVAHRFAPTIQLALSFGVDPYAIDGPVNEYAYIGRDLFLFERGANGTQAEANYHTFGTFIADAEKALSDARRFGIKATVQF